MQNLIAFIMKGRVQAILATAFFMLLALMVTPLAVFSMAIPGLATLRNGPQEGLVVIVSAVLVLTGIGGLLFQMPIPFALLGIMLWLPMWGLAYILGSSCSLAKALSYAALGGFFLVGLQYLLLDSPFDFWQEILSSFMQGRFDETIVPLSELDQLVDQLAQWMPGGVASSWFVSTGIALMLARWASYKLDNVDDAFGQEFRNLRFDHWWLILLPLLLIPMLLFSAGPGISSQLYLVGMMLFLFQGVSLAHAFAYWRQANRFWLVSLYVVLFIGTPYSTIMVAMLGYADGWLDFRAKAGIENKN